MQTLVQKNQIIRSLINSSKENPLIRNLAMSIVGDMRDQNFLNHLHKLYQFLKANFQYNGDLTGVETFQDAIATIKLQGGDCDDLTILACSLAESIGFTTKLVYLLDNGRPFHIYPQIGIPPIVRPLVFVHFDLSHRNIGFGDDPKKIFKK